MNKKINKTEKHRAWPTLPHHHESFPVPAIDCAVIHFFYYNFCNISTNTFNLLCNIQRDSYRWIPIPILNSFYLLYYWFDSLILVQWSLLRIHELLLGTDGNWRHWGNYHCTVVSQNNIVAFNIQGLEIRITLGICKIDLWHHASANLEVSHAV